MKSSTIIAALLVIGASAVPTKLTPNGSLLDHEEELMNHFAEWKLGNKKEYATQEEHDIRLQIFAENKAIVEQHNSEEHSWEMGLNKFADLTADEFKARLGFLGHLSTIGTDESIAPERHNATGNIPTSVDWRDHNMVNPIKDQAQCGSCWAFSTVDSYESAVAKKTSKLVSFSEQDLVDCAKHVRIPGSSQTCCNGCEGGLMDYGFQYLIDSQNGKDTTEASYPYRAKNGVCNLAGKSKEGAAPVTSFKDIAQGNEKALAHACAHVGVISVAVNAGISGWQLYQSGVFDPKDCNPKELDHGVAVVGFGSVSDVDSSKSGDYWIIRNSWGAEWGEHGYMRLSKGKNTCGVANSGVYPVV